MSATTTTSTTTDAQSTTAASRSDHTRGNSRAAGLFYILTFTASIPALLLLAPVLNDPGYILGAGHDSQVLFGCLLDVVTALTGIGSAVAVFPVVKRVNESMALGFVMSRMVEAAVILIGVVALLTVVLLRHDLAGSATADAASLTTTGQALVTARGWTFLLGPGFMASLNAVLFGTLLYPLTTGAPHHPHHRSHRRPGTAHRQPLDLLRPDHPDRHADPAGNTPDRDLGAVRRLLHGVQGLQARSRHGVCGLSLESSSPPAQTPRTAGHQMVSCGSRDLANRVTAEAPVGCGGGRSGAGARWGDSHSAVSGGGPHHTSVAAWPRQPIRDVGSMTDENHPVCHIIR